MISLCYNPLFLLSVLLQVGVSLAFVIHESANPHIGMFFPLIISYNYKGVHWFIWLSMLFQSVNISAFHLGKEFFKDIMFITHFSLLFLPSNSCLSLNYLPCIAAVLGRLPGTTVYRNKEQYPEAYTYNGIVIVRIDAPIYFANISYIKDR